MNTVTRIMDLRAERLATGWTQGHFVVKVTASTYDTLVQELGLDVRDRPPILLAGDTRVEVD